MLLKRSNHQLSQAIASLFIFPFSAGGNYCHPDEAHCRLMKILHFASHFSLLSETFIYDEIHALEKAFPNGNTFLTFERHLEKERPFPRVTVLSKTPSSAQKLRRRCLKLFKAVNVPRENLSLYSYLARNFDSFDLLQAHFGWNALPVCQTLRLLNWEKRKPIVVRCQGSDINSLPVVNPNYRKELLELARYPNVWLTANSEFMKQKMLQLGIAPARIRLVANAFNSAFPTHRKRQFFKPGDCLKLVNTARFIEWKGQRHLVTGFARFVREVYANATLTLIGDGQTLDQVKQLASREGIADQIKFPGSVPHDELAQVLSAHDLYVQPSIIDPQTHQEEGLPIAVLEALSVGLPLIVTRTGGMPEIVGADNTFARIVPDQDPEAIYCALKDMFETGACFQDTSAYAQNRLAAFTAERQLADLKSVYAAALGQPRQPTSRG